MNKITLTIFAILVASGLTLSACAPKTTKTNLDRTSWVLVSYGRVGKQTQSAPGIQTSLIFAADGQVSGNLGCNGFSGNYDGKGDKLVFGSLASTLMACPEPQMTQESIAFQVLAGTVQFVMEGDSLTIYDASGTTALTLIRIGNQ
jgi:putative lipoprotein